MTIRLAGVVLAVLLTAALLIAALFLADTPREVSPTNYRSEIVSVTPAPASIRFELLDLGQRVRVTNAGRSDLVILGYSDEPYLRVGPRGVFENVRSPSLYLNKAPKASASMSTAIPASADATAKPVWHKRSSRDRVTWREWRTRWERLAAVASQPNRGSTRFVANWRLLASIRANGSSVAVTGQIVWHPPPDLRRWLVVTLVASAVTAAIGLSTRWGVLMHIALALLVAISAVHSFAEVIPEHDSLIALCLRVVGAGYLLVAGWLVAVLSFRSLDGNGARGLFGAVLAAVLIGVHGGGVEIGTLSHSQVLYAAPPALARVAVSLSLGIGVGLLAAAALAYARGLEPRGAMPAG